MGQRCLAHIFSLFLTDFSFQSIIYIYIWWIVGGSVEDWRFLASIQKLAKEHQLRGSKRVAKKVSWKRLRVAKKISKLCKGGAQLALNVATFMSINGINRGEFSENKEGKDRRDFPSSGLSSPTQPEHCPFLLHPHNWVYPQKWTVDSSRMWT